MAFTEINGLDADVTVALGGTNKQTGKLNPKQIEGYYLGKREVADKKKKSGVSYIYYFQTPKGNVGVWGKTDLDKKMAAAVPGVMLRVTSTGTRPTPNGDMYTFKVEADADNTVDVGGLANAHSGSSFDSVDEDDGESDGFSALSDATDEDAEQDAALVAAAKAARIAKTNALLNGKGKKG